MTKTAWRRAWTLPLLALAVGCAGESPTAGGDEPVRADHPTLRPQFHEGELPGLPPLTLDEIRGGVRRVTPAVSSLDVTGLAVAPSRTDKSIRGRVSTDAAAVAVRLLGLGSGYWVLPVGAPDPLNSGEYGFAMSLEFTRTIPAGFHSLGFAAIGPDGIAGQQTALGLCFLPDVPDDWNACDPALEPPELVVSLGWDVDADLDLVVVTPSGQVVDAKNRTTAERQPGQPVDPDADGVGVLDHDSNGGCALDGLRRENLVFRQRPPAGRYAVFVNLFAACGQGSAHFRLTLHSRVDHGDGSFSQVETFSRSGALLEAQQNGGETPGLFVTEFTVE